MTALVDKFLSDDPVPVKIVGDQQDAAQSHDKEVQNAMEVVFGTKDPRKKKRMMMEKLNATDD